MSSPPSYTLYHASSMSSTYIIALFELFSVPDTVIKTIDVDFDRNNGVVFGSGEAEVIYRELKSVNPLGQFPTLIVHEEGEGEEGTFVLTEMAAIAFYLHDKYAANTPWSTASLTPSQLGLYYRLMVYIPANIYPWITLDDFPQRFVMVPHVQRSSPQIGAEEVYGWVKEKGLENLGNAFRVLEGLLRNRVSSGSETTKIVYAVGSARPTLVDVYIAMVAHYAPRPRPYWLQENCPQVYACCRETLKHPVLRKVFLAQDFEYHLAV